MKVSSIFKAVLMLFTGIPGGGAGTAPAAVHRPDEQVSDWQTALRYLKEGNKRYLEGRTITRKNSAEDRKILKDAQRPFAAIVACSDSRVSPEIIFDQTLGDIFVIRNAGNIAGPTTLGSLEFAVDYLKVPLVVAIGHNYCGAVAGALDGGEYSENLQSLIGSISPAIQNCNNLDEAIDANTKYTAEWIRANETIKNSGVKVISAHFDIEMGTVVFNTDDK
jgi:carbonic anhydrase